MRAALFTVLALAACTSPSIETGDSVDTGEAPPPWGDGPHTVTGRAYFFDVQDMSIGWIQDVEGARLYVLEAPELEVVLSPDQEHAFTIEGIPEGVELTLALEHPDYYPSLSATWPVDDLGPITFQALSIGAATIAGALVGADIQQEGVCHMATTVTAEGGDDIWAAGEAGATVSLDPAVPPEQGPYYFNPSVMPDPDLEETTSDGGVMVAGAQPGVYTWRGHKQGFDFDELVLTCKEGWLTNAAPPSSMYAHPVP